MKHFLLTVLYSLFIVLLSGCSGKPADVPNLFPCKITVKNGAAPIADAEVLLGSSGAASMWTAAGITNSSGIAVIHTNRLQWQGNGVPAGEYSVAVSKNPKAEIVNPPQEIMNDPDAYEKYLNKQQKEYEKLPREIPVQLSDFTVSPFKLTVSEGQENNLEIDISTFKPKK